MYSNIQYNTFVHVHSIVYCMYWLAGCACQLLGTAQPITLLYSYYKAITYDLRVLPLSLQSPFKMHTALAGENIIVLQEENGCVREEGE